MSDSQLHLDSDDDELKNALAAFGDGAMDLLLDEDELDVQLDCTDEELASAHALELAETESSDTGKPEIREIGFEENDSSLIRYTKELANAIYCGHPMPHHENRCGSERATKDRSVVFTVSQQPFALPLQVVREIVRRPAVTALPRTPAWLRGVTNVRGQIFSVIDLRYLLSLDANFNTVSTEKVILIHHERTNQSTAIVADRILGIRSLREKKQNLSDLDSKQKSIASAVATIEAGEIVLIDCDKLFESADLTAFSNQPVNT